MDFKKLMSTSAAALFVTGAILQGVAVTAFAHEHHAHNTSQQAMPDAQAIEHTMKKQFDKPEAPLTVMPVTIESGYAVAGWVQSGKGGRALLKKEHDGWRIQVCGGDGLKNASTLAQTGMPSSTADRLIKAIQAAEAKLPAEHLKKLSMFEGMVNVESGGHNAHSEHHKH